MQEWFTKKPARFWAEFTLNIETFVIADADGNYIITGQVPGQYLITPNSDGVTFTPADRSETITSSNLTGVNFTASGGSGGRGNGGSFSNDKSFGFGFGF